MEQGRAGVSGGDTDASVSGKEEQTGQDEGGTEGDAEEGEAGEGKLRAGGEEDMGVRGSDVARSVGGHVDLVGGRVVGGGGGRCCPCNNTHSRVTKEDRQHDIEFDNYIRRQLYTKM